MDVKVYVENLSGGYSNKKGQWFELPVPHSELVAKIGIDGVLEECIITDYESPFPIKETDSIENLNSFVSEFQALPDYIQKNAKVLVENFFESYEKLVDDWNSINFAASIESNEDLGHYVCEELGAYTIPSELKVYIDYAAIGRDYGINAMVVFVDGGVFLK
ncbi:antirestriction protein [Enterococcus sp. PF1-24]|uniref:antirestriction protein ArdA n=1 Tax=unclassified Enterococcus TaxID=2608891 RepID=UPI002474FCA7|nr:MULTISPECIES: antirestriction protein ArdA [unclassified Enterococcus]MDH6363692.1 antirestriction protein [Enterococcus sp. PFB1-1]MDH6400648.1 antirestriction protein [Enterococcus sp. PF1-24]